MPGQVEPSVTMYLNRSTGRYHVNVWFGHGGRFRPSLRTSNPEEAREAFEAFKRDILPGLVEKHRSDPPEPKERPVGDREDPRISFLCEYYTKTFLPTRNAKPKSIQKAEQVLREFELYCASKHIGRASQLAPRLIDAWAVDVRARGRHAKTLHNHLATVRAMLNVAVERELMTQSPIRKWVMPDFDEPEIHPLTLDQVKRVLEIIRERRPELYNIVTWIAWTGNRKQDAAGLRWHQVDTGARFVTRVNVKSPKLKRYPVSRSAVAAVEAERKRAVKGPQVFTDETGKPFSPDVLYERFVRALNGFERHVTLHDLRHSFASNMINVIGCPVPQVQVRMGHAKIETTMKYVKSSDGREYDDRLDKAIKARASQKPLKTRVTPRHSSKKPITKRVK